MNHKKWIKLSDNTKRLKVAKLDGHKNPKVRYCGPWTGNILTSSSGHIIPHYLYDLNAMHNVIVSKLPKQMRMQYRTWLMILCSSEDGTWDAFDVENATAAQQAEAFVLTMEPE